MPPAIRPNTPNQTMKLLCDEMLKGLARWLRAAGHDTLVMPDGTADRLLMATSVAEERFLLTRDRKLLEHRGAAKRVILLESNDIDRCAREIRLRLGLDWLHKPFSRCLLCNEALQATPNALWARVPPGARAVAGTLRYCPRCDRIFWHGSHTRRMLRRLQSWAVTAPI